MSFNLLESTLRFKGFPLDEASKEFLRLRNLSEEEFRASQQGLRDSIVEFHFKNNSFYRSLVGDKLPEWNDLPIMTKSTYQRDLEEMLSKGYAKRDVYISSTSGSSGHPFFFAKDKFCHALTWAGIKQRYGLHGIKLGAKQARFYGIPRTFVGNLTERLKDKLSNRVRFPVFDLSDKQLDIFIDRFRHIPFKIAYGYTSSLVFFARYVVAKDLVLKDLCPSLTHVIATSEVCTDEDRAILEKGFGVRAINEYGASESGVIAIEDADFDWITSDETLYVEILDENNRPVPLGQEGRVILTVLHNRAMPMIRYEIGDFGVLAPGKKGNNHILKKLLGRVNDFALLPSGMKSPGLTFYYISRSLLEGGGKLKEFIIRQKAIDTFQFDYVAESELSTAEKENVNKMMDKYLEPGLKSVFNRCEKIERPASGKIKHFYNELNKN